MSTNQSSHSVTKSLFSPLSPRYSSLTSRVTMNDQGTITPKYNSEDLFGVIFRLNASVWKDVIPFCIANSLLSFLVLYYSENNREIGLPESAHAFMSFTVSYLLINRTSLCLERYMNARTLLSNLTLTSKELIHHAVAFTRYKDRNDTAMLWRSSLAKRTISLLRVVVSILKVPSKKKNIWEESSIEKLDRQALLLAVGKSNERSPLVLTLFLRNVIASHIHNISPPLEVAQELFLLNCTNDFLNAYSELMVQISTPQPFPMVQMTKTFLFAYVFTLPFVLASYLQHQAALIFMTFFITYGLIGLELVGIEMDDPFGDDPNDFNVESIARNVYKDIIISIEDIDGEEAAENIESTLYLSVREDVKETYQQHTQGTRIGEWGGTVMGSKIENDEIDLNHSAGNVTPQSKEERGMQQDVEIKSGLLERRRKMSEELKRNPSSSSFKDVKGKRHLFRASWRYN